MLAKIAPLSQALTKARYYDMALYSAELAMVAEPTWDLRLAQAYLLLALGDTSRADNLYSQALQRFGSIPSGELERLGGLAADHPEEEDIFELYTRLRHRSVA